MVSVFMGLGRLILAITTLSKSVECEARVCEIESSVPGQGKPITYELDTCLFLAWHSALIGCGKHWLAQYQNTGAWLWWSDFPVL